MSLIKDATQGSGAGSSRVLQHPEPQALTGEKAAVLSAAGTCLAQGGRSGNGVFIVCVSVSLPSLSLCPPLSIEAQTEIFPTAFQLIPTGYSGFPTLLWTVHSGCVAKTTSGSCHGIMLAFS